MHVARLPNMQRLLQRHFAIVKIAAVGVAVFFAGSATSTYAANRLLMEYGVDAQEDSAPPDEDGEDGTKGEDEDATLASGARSNRLAAGRASGTSTKVRHKQASADAIVGNNLFCPTCVPVENQPALLASADPNAAFAGEVYSGLPLQLLATMESDDPAWSMATIRDMDTNSLGPFVPNEAVRPGVTILAVERGRVVLLNQGRREFISLGGEPPKAAPVKPPASKPATKSKGKSKGKSIAIAGADEAIDCSSENACTVDRKFIDKLLADPRQLMSQARMYPVNRDGDPAGFRVSGVRSGSLATIIGLKNGDVLSEVNGQKLGSIDDALGMYQKLRRASHLSVVVERGGAVITKEISIK